MLILNFKHFLIILVIFLTCLLGFIFLTENLPRSKYTINIKEGHRKFMSIFNDNYSNKLFRSVDVTGLNKSVIPSILYKTGHDEYENLPSEITDNFKKIIEENQGYTIEYYSDKDSMEFIEKNFDKEVLIAYKKLKPGAFKADLFRYCILYKKGGVYGDLTQTYLVNLDELVDREKDKLVLSRDSYIEYTDFGIDISFMASVKGLDLFDKCIKQIVENVKNKIYTLTSLGVTGPWLMRNIFIKNKEAQNLYKMNIKIERMSGEFNIFGDGKKCIKRKNATHNKYIYSKKLKYEDLWRNRDIYDNEIEF